MDLARRSRNQTGTYHGVTERTEKTFFDKEAKKPGRWAYPFPKQWIRKLATKNTKVQKIKGTREQARR